MHGAYQQFVALGWRFIQKGGLFEGGAKSRIYSKSNQSICLCRQVRRGYCALEQQKGLLDTGVNMVSNWKQWNMNSKA